MDLRPESGLSVGFVTVEEALSGSAGEPGTADLLRVVDPDRSVWPQLRSRGFVPKPASVSWITATGTSDQRFLAGLAKKERWSVRRAVRLAADDGVRFVVAQPVGAAELEAFFTIYLAQVQQMRFGIPYALSHQES